MTAPTRNVGNLGGLMRNLAKGCFITGITLMASFALAQFSGQECIWKECQPGDQVVTSPTHTESFACETQKLAAYIGIVELMKRSPSNFSPEADVTVTKLLSQSGAKNYLEAIGHCVHVPAAQTARVIELGAEKSGLARVAPVDGSPPYWLSNFDIRVPN